MYYNFLHCLYLILNLSDSDAAKPPFPAGMFDRVLLDAPCSALGQRPCVLNKMKENEVKSFPSLQRQLFERVRKMLFAHIEICH